MGRWEDDVLSGAYSSPICYGDYDLTPDDSGIGCDDIDFDDCYEEDMI